MPITMYSPERSASHSLDGPVSTGPLHTIIPAAIPEELGTPAYFRRQHRMADDGSIVSMPLGAVLSELQGEIGAVPVLFGADPDNAVIGATTLETLETFGYAADPHHRRLIPAELTI